MIRPLTYAADATSRGADDCSLSGEFPMVSVPFVKLEDLVVESLRQRNDGGAEQVD